MTEHPQQDLANAIRFLAIDAIVRAEEGHQGVPLGMAEIATALYTRHLKFNPEQPTWWDRDRVVLSNGHGSMLLYALLYLTGYDRISLDQIIKHLLPFVGVILGCLMLITYIPSISLALRDLVYAPAAVAPAPGPAPAIGPAPMAAPASQ